MLKIFQDNLGVDPPLGQPIFDAGSEESRGATLGLTKKHNDLPTAWIDVYYPYLDEPVNSTLEILTTEGLALWTADLTEDGDPLDPEAHEHRNDIPPWLGYSKEGIVEGQVRDLIASFVARYQPGLLQLVYANYGTQEARHFPNIPNSTSHICLLGLPRAPC